MTKPSPSSLSLCAWSLLAPLVSTAPAASQGPAPGFRLYSPGLITDTFLIDTNGTVVHQWPSTYQPGMASYLEANGTLIRSGRVPGGPAGHGGTGGVVQRIAFDGTVLWDYPVGSPTRWAHHDIEPMPNGNVLIIAWDRMTAADAIAAGRDPALIPGLTWMPDSIIEVEQTGPATGNVVWEWHVIDHVVQDFDPTKPNFGVVADRPELIDINFPRRPLGNGDWNHANAVAYDPVRDIVIVNTAHQNEFWFIDHSTTTAEAAGHTGGRYGMGGDILYRWGNPAAYGRGTSDDQRLFNSHGTYVIPQGLPGAGNVLNFNNGAGLSTGQRYSSVIELQLPASFALAPGAAFGPANPVWEYIAAPEPTSFYSSIISNAERLPNGNTLICSGSQRGWIFEVTQEKQKVWEHFNQIPGPTALLFHAHYYARYLWADRESVSAAAGETVRFDLVAGSPHAGRLYVLLGSASGTSPGLVSGGFTLPLNVDGYTRLTAAAAGGPILPSFLGSLDASGRANASLTLPPVPGLAGLQLHHAFAVVGAASTVTLTSNAVPLHFRP